MTQAAKKKGGPPKMSLRRKKWVKKTYRSKLDPHRDIGEWERNYEAAFARGVLKRDGDQFTKKKCTQCGCKLTNHEYDHLGLRCYDHY